METTAQEFSQGGSFGSQLREIIVVRIGQGVSSNEHRTSVTAGGVRIRGGSGACFRCSRSGTPTLSCTMLFPVWHVGLRYSQITLGAAVFQVLIYLGSYF